MIKIVLTKGDKVQNLTALSCSVQGDGQNGYVLSVGQGADSGRADYVIKKGIDTAWDSAMVDGASYEAQDAPKDFFANAPAPDGKAALGEQDIDLRTGSADDLKTDVSDAQDATEGDTTKTGIEGVDKKADLSKTAISKKA